MSASREKKNRQELNASGYVDTHKEEKKKEEAAQRRTSGLYTALLTVVVLGAIAMFVFNSGILDRSKTAATIDGEKYSVSDVSYYFYSTYNNFVSTYNDYLTSYGLDTTQPLREQECPVGDGSWFDYFADQALNTLSSVTKLAAAANAEGFDGKEAMDNAEKEMLEGLSTYAAQAGYTTNQYIKAVFGSTVTKKVLVKNVRLSALAEAYSAAYAEGLTYSDAELQAQFDADPKSYQSADIEYILYTYSADEDATDEEKANLLADMQANAKNAIARYEAGESLESIASETDSYYNHSANTAYGSSDMISWAFDDARKAGDTTTITSGDSSCYAVVFHSRTLNDYFPVSVRHILVADEETAKSVLAEYEAGAKTEDAFAALAKEHSTDNADEGGLYENIYKGQMVAEFNDWCFDKSRVSGDTGIVKTDYGYHVMYFVSASSEPYWKIQATESLKEETYNTWYAEVVGEPVIEQAAGMDQIG